MDYLERPDIKAKYDKCKYIVKLWEHNFKKSKGRQPSKLDIREADHEVRNAYKKYYQLKTTALEQSFQDVEGFNNSDEDSIEAIPDHLPNDNTGDVDKQFEGGAWGEHLTVEYEQNTEESKSEEVEQSAGVKKLFGGSRLNKRNPRKSGSLSQKSRSFVHVENTPETTQAQTKDSSQLSFEGLFSSVKVTHCIEHAPSHSTSLIQRVFNETNKPMRSVDSGWLDRVISANSDVPKGLLEENNSLHYGSDSEDIIDNSDDEELPPAKRQKFYTTKASNFSVSETPKPIIAVETSREAHRAEKVEEKMPVEEPFRPKTPENELDLPGTSKTLRSFSDIEKLKPIAENNPVQQSIRRESPSEKAENAQPQKSETVANARKFHRKTRTDKSMAESADENEDPYHTDNDSDDPEFHLNYSQAEKSLKTQIPEQLIEKAKDVMSKRKGKKKVTATKSKESDGPKKTRRKRTKQETESAQEPEDSTYELEYSVKPRISAPRFSNLKEMLVEKVNEKPEEAPTTNKDLLRLQKRIKAGTLNENFVSINLKKKIFCKGKKTMTFSKYKKQMWKNKKKALYGPDMDMGGCDGGALTCFNCGEAGHFARNCTKAKGDSLLPVTAEEPEEEHTIPTLEEAAQMAQDSVLAIRKSNMDVLPKDTGPDIFGDGDDEMLLAEALKLEEHVAKLDLQAYIDSTSYVKPFYDENVENATEEVYEALTKFGHSSFRPGQEKAIMRILRGESTLLTLSTGSGKSLCYQLPAYLYSKREPCIGLVISPLISLMEDQVTGIPSFLKAACLYSNQTKTQREKIMSAIEAGAIQVLLVSPEAVVAGDKSGGFGSILRKLPPIAFACIDEIHCISQWSHNFRPSYLMICRVLREKMGVKTILGLTATATRATCDSIVKHLEITDGIQGVISDTPLPPNLILTVSKDADKRNALLEFLSSDRLYSCNSIIIYCTMTKVCDAVASFLRSNLRITPTESGSKRKRTSAVIQSYHASLDAGKRRRIQKDFMAGDVKIVVATIAFGMGINKANIRAVIHYDMPKNFESYVQEIGRAGRDGLEAHCHMFLDKEAKDENELRRHIYANSIDRHVIRKLLGLVFVPCTCKGACPKHEVAFPIQETVQALDLPQENISTLLCYLELHQNKYIELLCPAYTTCKVISYGGPGPIKKAAQQCPPLAMAMALQQYKEGNVLEFDVISIASAIGWDSGICKHKLKNLEWVLVNGQSKRSVLTVQFDNLGFRMLAPGNLTSSQLDEALDSLCTHVTNQEKTALQQLRILHETMTQAAHPSYRPCLDEEVGGERQLPLKAKIREYFESQNPLDSVSLAEQELNFDEEEIVRDIHGLINIYRDNSFTGRAVARIFYGISSPNYPAMMWSKCKYWRKYTGVDFHKICDIAKREILKLK